MCPEQCMAHGHVVAKDPRAASTQAPLFCEKDGLDVSVRALGTIVRSWAEHLRFSPACLPMRLEWHLRLSTSCFLRAEMAEGNSCRQGLDKYVVAETNVPHSNCLHTPAHHKACIHCGNTMCGFVSCFLCLWRTKGEGNSCRHRL